MEARARGRAGARGLAGRAAAFLNPDRACRLRVVHRRRRRRVVHAMGARALSGLIGLAVLSQTALAHAHAAASGQGATVEWLVRALIALAAALYARGERAVWRRAWRRGVSV